MQRIMGGEFAIPYSMMQHANEVETSMFATGRSALRGIIRAISKDHTIERMRVPNYICDSVTKALQQEHVPYDFYEVGFHFYPKSTPIGDVVLLVNYFGIIDVRSCVTAIKENNPDTIVIKDIEHWQDYVKAPDIKAIPDEEWEAVKKVYD